MQNHGSELSKNTLYLKSENHSTNGLLDGQREDTLDLKDLIIAHQVPLLALEELSVTHTIELVFTLELKFQVQTEKSCPANGNIKSVHALVLKLEITCGWQDTLCKEFLKTSMSLFHSIQSQSQEIGMELAAIQTTQQNK